MRRSRSPHTRYGPVDDPADLSTAPSSQKGKARPGISSAVVRPQPGSSNSAEERPIDLHEPRSTRRDKFSKELIADAKVIFARRLGRDVSEDEARALLGDLADYYTLAGDHAQAAKLDKAHSQRRKK
uniref:hypothetical protein n=1 Tax=Edaphosphingomonas laterariae TaxID=861865 RepID=UPI00118185CC|nr:hypothetical protein [Sphingomonas laterariae]